MEPLTTTTGVSASAPAAGGPAARGRTLSQAESEDFASAQVPLQVALDHAPAGGGFPRTPLPLPTPPVSKGRTTRFSFSATAVDGVIQEAECEEEEEEEEEEGDVEPVASAVDQKAVGPQDFDLLCVIGQGAFGKVRTAVCGGSRRGSDVEAVAAGHPSAPPRDERDPRHEGKYRTHNATERTSLHDVSCNGVLATRSCRTSTSSSTSRSSTCRRSATS